MELPNALNHFKPPGETETIANRLVDPHAFCRLRFSPILVTGVLLDLLRSHYGNPTAIMDPMLHGCVWRGNDQTGIMIESCTNDALTRIQMRPAILIRRNAVRPKREGLDDELKSLGGERDRSFVVTLHGSHTLFCLSGKPGHADVLANETAMYLLQAAPAIRGKLCFRGDFRLEEIGELGTVEGLGGQYVVPLTFAYVTDYAWSITSDAPTLRHIDMSILLNPDG